MIVCFVLVFYKQLIKNFVISKNYLGNLLGTNISSKIIGHYKYKKF